ncbi:hypothetical protein E2562_024480 [Oryza meyeriana var. granulata]|uniref:Uncharacterized protein n=1 Tax=Oryza meyeriana var. granulata TaxID=110450 RepID=A0A6G1FBJ9_9ORYZ|nr:hypothetical protein E2562_024480 [Oryza meyeriana var. granulata]
MSRRLGVPHAAAVLLILWLAVLTFASHGYGGRLGLCSVRRRILHHTAFHLPTATTRKMLLAAASFDASSPSSSSTTATDHRDRHHHHHRHHSHHHRGHDRWNRQGIPPTAGEGEEVDPRFGVQKRLVPTGPNPLHH